jgi:very-short-patch-repair endonuclease
VIFKMRYDSPIEQILGQALLNDKRFLNLSVRLETQVELKVNSGKRYRLDLLIRNSKTGRGVLVIECDGKDFHSRPKQIKYDRKRDSDIKQTFGVNTLRFTGSEINKNLQGCVNTVLYRVRGILR